jgi:hypothetical protein
LRLLNEATYGEAIERLPEKEREYWKRAQADRWRYMSYAVAQIEKWGVQSMLEMGCGGLPLSPDSDTMDVEFSPKIKHSAGDVPWPIEDKAYDAFVALQVWEHLEGAQREAFAEVRRVARRAILSFPLMWNTADPVHGHISREKIHGWVGETWPDKEIVIGNYTAQRIVMMWDFDK